MGYAIPLGDSGVLLDIGANYIAGGAKIKVHLTHDTAATADVIFEVDDMYTGLSRQALRLATHLLLTLNSGYTHAHCISIW